MTRHVLARCARRHPLAEDHGEADDLLGLAHLRLSVRELTIEQRHGRSYTPGTFLPVRVDSLEDGGSTLAHCERCHLDYRIDHTALLAVRNGEAHALQLQPTRTN